MRIRHPLVLGIALLAATGLAAPSAAAPGTAARALESPRAVVASGSTALVLQQAGSRGFHRYRSGCGRSSRRHHVRSYGQRFGSAYRTQSLQRTHRKHSVRSWRSDHPQYGRRGFYFYGVRR